MFHKSNPTAEGTKREFGLKMSLSVTLRKEVNLTSTTNMDELNDYGFMNYRKKSFSSCKS